MRRAREAGLDQKTAEGQEPCTCGGLANSQSENPKTGECQDKGTRSGFVIYQSGGQEPGARGGLDHKTGESQETSKRGGFAKDQNEGH